MKEESKRQRQVAAIVQREFSVVLQQEGKYIYGDALVTVTQVRMNADLSLAYIYVSVYNAMYKQEVVKELWENIQRLRGELGKRIRKQVRRIPLLKFFLDDTLDQADELDRLLSDLDNPNGSTRSMKQALEDRNKEE